MGKSVKFNTEAREGLQRGVNILADAVKATLGPRGRHAAIERNFGPPLITKDGVTVAKSITLDDRMQNMGAELVKSVASSTNSLAGDGTTTATVLAQAIYNEGARMVAAGHNPVLIKRGIDKAVEVVVGKLRENACTVHPDSIKDVAIISANNDKALGTLIGEAVSNVGNDGMISVEEGTGSDTRVEYTEGITFDRGYISPTFSTNLDRLTVEYDNPFILIYDGRISNTYDILTILEEVSKTNRPILIIAQTVESEALQTLIVNRARGALSCCAVKAPGFGDYRRDVLGDIAAATGAQLLTSEQPDSLKSVTLAQLGRARRVLVSREETTIVDGAGSDEDIEARVRAIKIQSGDVTDTVDLAHLKQRLSMLSGSVAVFKVGGVSEAEVKEKKDRVEDAINAVKAAIDEGIVSGGGSSLLHCLPALEILKKDKDLITEELIGVDVVIRAVKAPFRQILENAGMDHFSYMEKIVDAGGYAGFDALRGIFCPDMIKAGIIDPVKVVRSAIENAASASGTLLTTEVAIFTNVEDAK